MLMIYSLLHSDEIHMSSSIGYHQICHWLNTVALLKIEMSVMCFENVFFKLVIWSNWIIIFLMKNAANTSSIAFFDEIHLRLLICQWPLPNLPNNWDCTKKNVIERVASILLSIFAGIALFGSTTMISSLVCFYLYLYLLMNVAAWLGCRLLLLWGLMILH